MNVSKLIHAALLALLLTGCTAARPRLAVSVVDLGQFVVPPFGGTGLKAALWYVGPGQIVEVGDAELRAVPSSLEVSSPGNWAGREPIAARLSVLREEFPKGLARYSLFGHPYPPFFSYPSPEGPLFPHEQQIIQGWNEVDLTTIALGEAVVVWSSGSTQVVDFVRPSLGDFASVANARHATFFVVTVELQEPRL